MNENLTCNETAEYVSALCDGEIIPPEAASHIGACETCQQRLNDYVSMGVELRRVASLETATVVPPRTWTRPHAALVRWWQKGLESMRVPRMAFGALLIALIVMGSGWMLSKVRARANGTVVILQVESNASDKDGPLRCALSTLQDDVESKRNERCAFSFMLPDRIMYGFQIQMLSRDDNRVRLGIRTIAIPSTPIPGKNGYGATMSLEALNRQPQREVVFTPGEALQIDTPGAASLTLHGEWTDHVPSLPVQKNQSIDPGPDEMRMVSPLLLRDKEVIGDLEGGTAVQEKPGEAVTISLQGYGVFLISASHIEGARQASVSMNRISFEETGHSYLFITGVPVSRGQTVWVLHHKPNTSGSSGGAASIGTLFLTETSPGIWRSPYSQE